MFFKKKSNAEKNKIWITTYFYKGTETVLATKDELVKQLPFLNKKFLSYHDFAKAGIIDLLSEEKLEKADEILDTTEKKINALKQIEPKEPVVETEPTIKAAPKLKPARTASPAKPKVSKPATKKKTTSTTRRKPTTKTKTDS